MNIRRMMPLGALLVVFASAGNAQKKDNKGPEITDQIFRQTSSLLLDDPLNRSARDWSRLILLYALQPSKTVVVGLGPEELHWIGLEENDSRSVLLLAAYVSGNLRSQLNSGVKRNDRYSGLLTLFRVYRALREQNKGFRIADVNDLLNLHTENKLIAHLQKLDETKPAKRTRVEEAIIRKIMEMR
jgi:hypothetical protein